jgi:hypothetical protein
MMGARRPAATLVAPEAVPEGVAETEADTTVAELGAVELARGVVTVEGAGTEEMGAEDTGAEEMGAEETGAVDEPTAVVLPTLFVDTAEVALEDPGAADEPDVPRHPVLPVIKQSEFDAR